MHEIEAIKGEREGVLERWLDDNKIRAVVFDIDDTLHPMSKIYRGQFQLFAQFVANRLPWLSEETVYEKVVVLNDEEYRRSNVDQRDWSKLLGQMQEWIGEGGEIVYEGRKILTDIFRYPVSAYPDAAKTVRLFKKYGRKVGLLSNGYPTWVKRKGKELGIWGDKDYYVAVPPQRKKTSRDMAKLISKLEVRPDGVVVFGDSLSSDINPAFECGVKHVVWVHPVWEVNNYGKKPVGVIEAANVYEGLWKLVAS